MNFGRICIKFNCSRISKHCLFVTILRIRSKNQESKITFLIVKFLSRQETESAESIEQGTEKEPERPRHEKSKKRKRKLSQSSNNESRESKWHKNCTQCKKTAAESIIKRCKLTDEYLKKDHLRILKESNGLFYAGVLNVVQPNEIYAINLDGERGNKPHILPKEDILRDAVITRFNCRNPYCQLFFSFFFIIMYRNSQQKKQLVVLK